MWFWAWRVNGHRTRARGVWPLGPVFAPRSDWLIAHLPLLWLARIRFRWKHFIENRFLTFLMIAAHMFIISIISSVLNCTYRKTNQLSKLFNYRLNYCYMLRVKLFVVVVQVLVCVVYHWKYCTGRLAKIHRQDVFILYSTFRFSLKWRGTEIILR